MIELTAASLTSWQRGRRKWALERQWSAARWSPKSLFDSCLRNALFQMASGKATSREASQEAVTRYLTLAANPGLDLLSGNPYVIAMDYCAMLRTILEYAGRAPLLMVKNPASVDLGSGVRWKPLAWQDDSGMLHRWITVDHLDADRTAEELHGWFVFGDIAALRAPMTIHVIEIGQIRNGRRESPWARTYKHPSIANVHRFQKNDGGGLTENWKKLYFADNSDSEAGVWVDLMIAQRVDLVKHIPVKIPAAEHVEGFAREAIEEAVQMQQYASRNPLEIPKCRVACDRPSVCAFQDVCYSSGPATVERFVGFNKR